MANQETDNQHKPADQVTNDQHMVEEIHQPEPGHADQGNPLLALDPGMAIWYWLVFFAFVFILWKVAWRFVVKMLDERKSDIQKALDDAETARKSLETASDTQRQLIEEGRQRASDITRRADESSRKLVDEIREKAREESEKMIESARVRIDRQKEKAISEIKSEVVDLAVSIAARLIKENLDDDLNQKLVKDYIEEISD